MGGAPASSAAAAWRGRQVVVLGLMGAGKSTLGAALSERLARPLRDNDLDLWATYRTTAHDLARRDSVARLHEIEARVLQTALGGPPSVVAAAASTIEVPLVRAVLAAGPLVVGIEGPDELLAARYASGRHRPDLGAVLPLITAQRRVRGPLMRRAAGVTVDAAMPPPAQVDMVLAAWRAGA